ncbi:MAG: hypothetical protein HY833_00125 [Candidatus Aenigmarchaeota archaeon]|nr:hypothetical protein [Candidatus Aenigmarchaeota archaeon]
MRLLVPMIFVAAIASSVAYFFASYGIQEIPPSGCRELSASEIDSAIGSFMEGEGHSNYTVENVSPVYCGAGFSTYNVNSEIAVRPGEPTQGSRNMRLQIRSDSGGIRVYEVLLSNPSKELLG